MTQENIDAYVRSALALAGYHLAPATTEAVAVEFDRIQAIAATFVDLPMPVALESAEVFRP